MKFITKIIFCFLLTQSNAISKQKLVWSDEFNGNSLDYSKWGVEENAYGGGNNELQIYRWDKKNLRIENGNLVIEAHKDNPNVAGTTRPILLLELEANTGVTGNIAVSMSEQNCPLVKECGRLSGCYQPKKNMEVGLQVVKSTLWNL